MPGAKSAIVGSRGMNSLLQAGKPGKLGVSPAMLLDDDHLAGNCALDALGKA